MSCAFSTQKPRTKTRRSTHPPLGDSPRFRDCASVHSVSVHPSHKCSHFSTKQQDIVTASFLPFVFPLQQSTRTLIKCAEGRRLSLLFPAVGCDKKRGRREGHRRKMLKRANIIPTTMSTTTTNSVCVCGPQNRLPASPPSPLATTAPTKKEKKKKNTEQSVIKLATLNQPTQSRILASRPPTSQLKQQS